MSGEDFAKLRAAHRQRQADLIARYPLPTPDAWLARANELGSAVWAIAGEYQRHPLSMEWSGLVLLESSTSATYWSACREGLQMRPVGSEQITLRSFTGAVRATDATALWDACASIERAGMPDVPSDVYDGTPVTLRVRTPTGATLAATCNAASTRVHRTLVFARAFVAALSADGER